MALIIAAKTGTQEAGEAIVEALAAEGVAGRDMQLFYVNPPGQHDIYPIGGDMQADPGAESASGTQATGVAAGAAVGAVAGAAISAAVPLVAPAVVAGLAGVGAHVGGLVGVVTGTRDADEEKLETDSPDPGAEARNMRRGGMMIAVHIDPAYMTRDAVVETLRRMGAHELEQAEGQWRNGDWIDFDPTQPPRWVDAGIDPHTHERATEAQD